MASNNQLSQDGLGSTDWAGGTAPPGGTHSGSCTITMIDGTQYNVQHSRAEVLSRINTAPGPPTNPAWIGFDYVKGGPLNARNIARVK